MARGGYRAPSGGPRVSGSGAASQRSDANQPVNVGRVGDSEDLTQGDRQKLEAAMHQRPLGRAQTPQLSAPETSPMRGDGNELPQYLFEMPTNRPDEPSTAGLPFGDGPGPEALQSFQAPTEKEQLVRYLASRPDASPQWQAVVQSMVDEQRPPQQPVAPQRLSPMQSVEPAQEAPAQVQPEADIAPDQLPPEQLESEPPQAQEEPDAQP